MSDHVEVLRELLERELVYKGKGYWLVEARIVALEAAIDSLRQVPEGYVLVPREPTPEMVSAATSCATTMKGAWRAMVDVVESANPAQPTSGSMTTCGHSKYDPCHNCEPVGDGETADDLLATLLDYIDRNTCAHEETHRGGHIWTICDSCGRKWADDEGGFVPHQDAPEVSAARAYLDSLARRGG